MGAASLTAVLALGDGIEAFARRSIEREGWQVVSLSAVTQERVDGLIVPRTDYPSFSIADADALAGIATPGARVSVTVDGTAVMPGAEGRNRALLVMGRLDLPGPDASQLTIASGRHFSADEARHGAAVAVINHRLAEELKALNRPGGLVGERLVLGAHTLEVVGVLAPVEDRGVLGILVPLDRAEGLMVAAPARRPRSIAIHVADITEVAPTRDRVQEFVDSRPDWNGTTRVSALGRERLEQLEQTTLAFKLVLGAFTAISLLVGGVGIMNVLLASILERTREIGVRKAVGARRRDVLWQFLIESITISSLGTAVGLVFGLLGAFGVTAMIRSQSNAPIYAAWTWQTGAVAAVAAMSIGILAGLYPAVRASRLTPLDAIQRE